MSRFKPHSIRASSTSAAALAKVLLDTILWTADWSGHCTFAKYYKKTNPRTWEFGRSWSLVVILLSHHEVPGITCPPLLAYEINPLNLILFAFQSWFLGLDLMWSLAPHDDPLELPSNFNLQVSRVNLLIYWATYVKRSEYAQWTNLIMGCNASKIAERLKSSGRKKLLSARCFDIFLLSNILLVEIKRSFWWSDLDFRNNKRKCTFDQFQKAEINYDETPNERISELKSFYELYISQSLRI